MLLGAQSRIFFAIPLVAALLVPLVMPVSALAAEPGPAKRKLAVLDVKPTGEVDAKKVEGLSALIRPRPPAGPSA